MLKPTSPAEENPFEKIMGCPMRFSWEKMLEMMKPMIPKTVGIYREFMGIS